MISTKPNTNTTDTLISMQRFFDFNKRIADSSRFNIFILLTIIFAGILVGIQTYERQVTHIAHILEQLDIIVLLIFTVEVFIKVFAEGTKPLNYFKDPWNIFDFSIVAVCYLAFVTPDLDASFIAVLRLARILRVFKLVTAIPKLQLLVGALLRSIPSMGYVGVLLFLLFYIYAAMAVFIYGDNDPVHFENLHLAMLSLFRVVTLEDWTDIMYINMYGCDQYGYDGIEELCTNPSASPIGAALFFVSFVLIGTMVIMNLFIGVIMTSMEEAKQEANQDTALGRNQKRVEALQPGTGGKSKAEEIKEIKELLDSGAINEDDYEKMKREIIG
jgi:voltage-gated sodium channel